MKTYKTPLKTIVISQKHYDKLKELGRFGESFDDVVGRLLDQGL